MATMSRLTRLVKNQTQETLIDWIMLGVGTVMLTVAIVLTLSGPDNHRGDGAVEQIGTRSLSPWKRPDALAT